MADRPLTYTQIDREVRRLLDGARLVCEVDWPADLVMEVKKAWFFLSPASYRTKADFIRAYPALGVLYLVDHGVHHYEANEFWTALKLGAQQQRTGEAFEQALRTLDLETFPQFASPTEKARRFVAPILAHGGIPESMASDFLTEVLFPALRRGHGSTGAELVARWRRDRPPALRTTVARFLLFGGKTAVDLLDRLIALASIPRADLEAGVATGVPAHLVRAFLAVPAGQVPSPRPALPRPSIELDPWGDQGPVLRLPPVAREIGENLVWIVDDGSGTTHIERAYPRRDLSPLPLFPALAWSVTAKRGEDILFERTFECFGDNKILCFDEGRAYLPDAEGIKADHAWIVSDGNVQLASVEAGGYRELDGETSTFFGAWSRQRVMRVDLRSVEVLATLVDGKEVGRVPVLRATAARPEFTDDPLRDVHSQEGLDARAELPTLALPSGTVWTVRVVGPSGSGTRVEPAAALPVTVRLDELAPRPVLGTWDVSVTGPLGSDFTSSFVLVPGLVVATPESPVDPQCGDIEVVVSISNRDVKFPGCGWGEPTTVVVPVNETRVELWAFARDHAGKAGLFVNVPRVRWAFRTGDQLPEFAAATIAFEPEQLGVELASLLVSTGRPEVLVRVLLEDLDGDLLEVVGSRRSNADGQFKVDLAGIRDTARALADGGLRLVLGVGDLHMVVASHPARRVAPEASPSAPASHPDGPACDRNRVSGARHGPTPRRRRLVRYRVCRPPAPAAHGLPRRRLGDGGCHVYRRARKDRRAPVQPSRLHGR